MYNCVSQIMEPDYTATRGRPEFCILTLFQYKSNVLQKTKKHLELSCKLTSHIPLFSLQGPYGEFGTQGPPGLKGRRGELGPPSYLVSHEPDFLWGPPGAQGVKGRRGGEVRLNYTIKFTICEITFFF